MDAIEQLKSVLCDPEGKCCIAGSDEDRAIIDRALQALTQRTTPPAAQPAPVQEPVAWAVFEGRNAHDLYLPQEYVEALKMAEYKGDHAEVKPLYTAPPAQRQPLTEEYLIAHFNFRPRVDTGSLMSFINAVRFAEAAHGIKGEA
jgi:hypothetical protein